MPVATGRSKMYMYSYMHTYLYMALLIFYKALLIFERALLILCNTLYYRADDLFEMPGATGSAKVHRSGKLYSAFSDKTKKMAT